ncbi:superfamily II DNA/RNA helicase [Actinoplanes lutulentus]|uniref:Superfamily II DNA/RNA helicase n=1 Tax=Actinoplanes lutulentus TaxID=1287878 RepID=A0A327ZDG4_9ACTN|nr:DEAD/DEAH box helicase [Actinoplanes lutulentus]MBB2942781.1 superfamily II DNA/RNA helicase [Actinoplanes lutulentus]RAK38361.1 superfamily II DNA/RNA helicase [Actinoplanes lutulentus]
MTTFTELGVPAALATALTGLGITSPFPIQTATLPDTLAGKDVLGRGRTGSGKTYAFVIPLVARLATSARKPRAGRPRALILAPTRELATQIEATLKPLADAAGLRTLVVFGGVGANPQIKALKAGVDVLVACPGRLDDHIRNGHAALDDVEITVLDEADHMADLGFLPVVRRLMSQTPAGGQRLLFSATLDNGVDVLVQRFMRNPITHHVDSAAQAPVEMDHHVLHVQHDDRFDVLVELLAAPGRSVVFTRTKRRAKILTRQLNAAGVPAVELHGNLAQNARNRNLSAFSDGTAGTLVATDIAARGIHVDDVALVIHADPPVEHKAYLHRSGRTARAGARGTVITLMTDDQQADVRDLTRKAGIRPATHRTRPGDTILAKLAPGERIFVSPAAISSALAVAAAASAPARGSSEPAGDSEAGAGASRRRRGGRGRRPASATQGESRSPKQAPAKDGAGKSQNAGQARSASSSRGSGQARGSATRSGTPQQRPASSGGAAAFSSRSSGRRSGR